MKLSFRQGIRVSIRAKIIGVLAASLGTSLLCYLWVGTSLIKGDRQSYVFDMNLAQLQTVADSVEAQIQRTARTARYLTELNDAKIDPGILTNLFNEQSAEAPVAGLLILKPTPGRAFEIVASFGKESAEARKRFETLAWTPEFLAKKEDLVAEKATSGLMPLGGKFVTARGRPFAFFALLSTEGWLSGQAGGTKVYLLDPEGRPVGQARELEEIKGGSEKVFRDALTRGGFESGALDWENGKDSFIVGYRRIARDHFILVSFISRKAAFQAVDSLVRRSIVLGLSVLLLAVALTLVGIKSWIARLKQMWDATKKVAEGDFTSRVPAVSLIPDELGGLAQSFNTMADKIDQLMAETAEKARMETELKTGRTVQARFFPTAPFDHPSIRLAGAYSPASECGGDWWYYKQVGDFLVVVVGDVTGHGVSAALVTASAHGVFCHLMEQLERSGDEPDLSKLMTQMNNAVLASAQGKSNMTFVAGVINLRTGVAKVANASHPPIYLFRSRPDGTESSEPADALVSPSSTPLGEARDVNFEIHEKRLQPGDLLLWHTDGLWERRESDGQKMRKVSVLRTLAQLNDRTAAAPLQISTRIMSEVLAFHGLERRHLPDDITVLVLRVSRSAVFEHATGSAPSPRDAVAA